ncbi:MAG: outer membrane protein assembly factor BamE [Cocleimonas sp.]
MNKIISIITLTLLLNGCAIYRAEVQQGNALSNETVSQLQRGMSKAEVASLLGNPLLQDNFRSDRWDYIFFNGTGGQQKNKQSLVLLFKNDQLVQVKK